MAINIFIVSKIILTLSLILLAMECLKLLTAFTILASEKLLLASAKIKRKPSATAQEKAHLQTAKPAPSQGLQKSFSLPSFCPR